LEVTYKRLFFKLKAKRKIFLSLLIFNIIIGLYKNLTLAFLSLFTLSARVRSIHKEKQNMAAINSSGMYASIAITVLTSAKKMIMYR
jgi:hypothetical protein